MAYKVFTNGSVLQASEINDNLMRQSVMVFSNAAARSAAITVPLEGMLTWLQDTDQYENYNGSAWVQTVVPSALSLIKSQAIGSGVSSIVVSSAFSSTYDNYKIMMSGGVATTDAYLSMRLGSTATGYYQVRAGFNYSGAANNGFDNNTTQWTAVARLNPNYMHLNIDLNNPFLSKNTTLFSNDPTIGGGGIISGIQTSTTSFTAFTLTVNTGSITGGSIQIYGYSK